VERSDSWNGLGDAARRSLPLSAYKRARPLIRYVDGYAASSRGVLAIDEKQIPKTLPATESA
jgi:hypothetical protein